MVVSDLKVLWTSVAGVEMCGTRLRGEGEAAGGVHVSERRLDDQEARMFRHLRAVWPREEPT